MSLISIIMPYKNSSRFLKETLLSIQNQSYKNFEVIGVNDHSDDDSEEIFSLFSKTDNRFKTYLNEGEGIISALKTGVKKYQGDYITRQDSDDLMPVDKLDVLLNVLKDNERGCISTGKVQYFSDDDLNDGFKKYEKWLNDLIINNNHYEKIFKECVIASSNWLIHKKDFDLIGGFNDLTYPEDYHFVFKLFSQGIKIKSTLKVTHFWRDHQNRASRILPEYMDQKFFSLKLYFFNKLYPSSKIILWGAGPTGKKLAKLMIEKKMTFRWITNNAKKIGKYIYGVYIENIEIISKNKDSMVIISVTQKNQMFSIQNYLKIQKHKNYLEF